MTRSLLQRLRTLFGARERRATPDAPDAPAAPAAPAAPPAAPKEDAAYARAMALREAGRHREAVAAFQQAIDARHDHVQAHLFLGRSHRDLEEPEDAMDAYAMALAFDPGCTGARLDLATLHADYDNLEAAVSLLEEAVESKHAEIAIFSRLAKLHKRRGDPLAARAVFECALERLPDEPVLHLNYGMLWLAQLGDPVQAEAHFRRALFLRPGFDAAQSNLGLALEDQGRFDEALALYERSIALRPDPAEYRWNRALALLALGRHAEAWDDYELRKTRPDAGDAHTAFHLPDWDGGPLEGRTLLVYAEQGVGDEIMFASCLPEVIAQARECVLECDPRLVALFGRSFAPARVMPRGASRSERRTRVRDLNLVPDLDLERVLQSAIASLPRVLRRSEAAFPWHAGYLRNDPAQVARWRERLREDGEGMLIGLSWRGGTIGTRGKLRSMSLESLAPLLELPSRRFVILQRGLTDEERAMLAARRNVIVPDVPEDLDALAALLGALDLLVAVDGTPVHLAGALGRPVLAMLSRNPEWRYGVAGERMPWYPSVRLMRQAEDGWTGVVERVRERIAGRAADGDQSSAARKP